MSQLPAGTASSPGTVATLLAEVAEPFPSIQVGYAILYLASEESKFVTGSGLVVDGGYTAR